MCNSRGASPISRPTAGCPNRASTTSSTCRSSRCPSPAGSSSLPNREFPALLPADHIGRGLTRARERPANFDQRESRGALSAVHRPGPSDRKLRDCVYLDVLHRGRRLHKSKINWTPEHQGPSRHALEVLPRSGADGLDFLLRQTLRCFGTHEPSASHSKSWKRLGASARIKCATWSKTSRSSSSAPADVRISMT
jgi:hypothetical protein